MANTMRWRKRLAGYSMLETIIGLAVLGTTLTFALQMQQTGEDQATGRNTADNLSSFSQMAAQFFIANRTAMEKAMDDGTDADKYCMVNVNADGTGGTVAQSTTKKTCALDATLLRARGTWPTGMSVDTFGGRYVVIFRRVLDASAQPTGGVDALFVLASPSGALSATSLTPSLSEQLAASQTTMGGVGGIVPVGTLGACAAVRSTNTYEVCGNGWKVNLSDFVDTAALTTFASALPN